MTNVLDHVVEEIKTQILCSFLNRKSCGFWNNVGKYGTALQDRDGNIIWYSVTGQRWQYNMVQRDRTEMAI